MLNSQVIGPQPYMGCQPGHKGVRGPCCPGVAFPPGWALEGTVEGGGWAPRWARRGSPDSNDLRDLEVPSLLRAYGGAS